jgi:hypothetical protein
MDLNFKQQAVLVIITGAFVICAALISKSESPSTNSSPVAPYSHIQENGKTTTISNVSNSTATSTVNTNIIDNRTLATNGGTAININNNSSNNSNISINGKSYSE